MQITVLRADDSFTQLSLAGRLDVEGVDLIQDKFVSETTTRRRDTLVDMSEVTFIASLGIGMLLGVAKALHRHGAKLVLVNPTQMVDHTLRTAGIDEVIPIVQEDVHALDLFR